LIYLIESEEGHKCNIRNNVLGCSILSKSQWESTENFRATDSNWITKWWKQKQNSNTKSHLKTKNLVNGSR